jgi:hypothetical protein
MIFPTSTASARQVLRGQTESPTKSFSHAFPFSQERVAKVTQTLATTNAIPMLRASVLAEASTVCQFLGVDPSGHVFTLTSPKANLDDQNAPFYVASATDIIGKSVPVQLSAADFFATVTSLIPTSEVTELRLCSAEEMPDTVPGAGPVDDQAAPCRARLAYPETAGDDLQFACIAKVLPIPAGISIPPSPWLVTETRPDFTAVFPAGEVWRKAMAYAIQHNEGWSVTKGGPLFDLSGIRPNQFNQEVADTVTLEFTMIPVYSPHFAQVDNSILEMSQEVWSHLGGQLPPVDPPPNGGTPPPAQQNPLTPDIFRELVVGLNQNLRPALEKENTLTQEDIIQRYALFFAALEPSQERGGPPTVTPGILSPSFTHFLRTAKISTAQRDLKEFLETAFTAAATSDHRLDANASFEPRIVDKVMTASFRDFNFLSQSINAAHDQIKHTLNLPVFAAPHKASATYLNRVHHDNTVSSQEAVGEESSKMARKNNELYIDGKLATGKDIKTLLCNFRIFGRAMCPAFESSELWKAMAPGEIILHSKNGDQWLAMAGVDAYQVALNLLTDFQDIVNPFVQIANTSEYRTAFANGEPISPTAYQQANALSEEITTTLSTAVQRHSLGQYESHTPACARAFAHMRAPPQGRGGGPPNDGMHRGPATPVGQRTPARNNTPPAGGDHPSLRTSGFLKWSGSGPPPVCSVIMKLPTMASAERICMRFCTRGMDCSFGAKCRFAHLNGLQQIPSTAMKEAFVNFIKKTSGLEFIPGQGPPGTN